MSGVDRSVFVVVVHEEQGNDRRIEVASTLERAQATADWMLVGYGWGAVFESSGARGGSTRWAAEAEWTQRGRGYWTRTASTEVVFDSHTAGLRHDVEIREVVVDWRELT